MTALNLPSYPFKTMTRNGKPSIFDVLSKKYVALTPEEWVRQHFTRFLLEEKGYPQGLLANEVQVSLNGTRKRCDTVLVKRVLTARMIVEYKAPSVEITQDVFNQITRYNRVLRVEYLVVSNGLRHYCCRINYSDGTYGFLPEMPRGDEWETKQPATSPLCQGCSRLLVYVSTLN